MAYNWNLPAPSAWGPSSPYMGQIPAAFPGGPASPLPSAALGSTGGSLGLTAGNAATEAGLVRQALPAAGQAAAAAAPAARGLVGTAEGLAFGPPKPAALSGVRGLVNNARYALTGGGEGAGAAASGGLIRSGMRAAPYAIVGQVGGNALDESNLLGGSESYLNDAASKALKWGGAGAAIGSIVPGIGTLAGGLAGAGIGLVHEGLERNGVLKAPTIQQQVDTTIHTADNAARQVGLPEPVLDTIKQQYQAQQAFVDKGDKATRTGLADQYAQAVQQQAVAYAADPASFQNDTGSNAQEAETRRQLLMQATMVNAIKPYADEMMASSNANAQMLDNLAGQGGELAPLYAQRAASERAAGARYAAGLVQQAQVTPYEQALRDQASYLSQASQNLVSQGMSAALNPQQSAAGSTDLTAIIDGAANQLQPQ